RRLEPSGALLAGRAARVLAAALSREVERHASEPRLERPLFSRRLFERGEPCLLNDVVEAAFVAQKAACERAQERRVLEKGRRIDHGGSPLNEDTRSRAAGRGFSAGEKSARLRP